MCTALAPAIGYEARGGGLPRNPIGREKPSGNWLGSRRFCPQAQLAALLDPLENDWARGWKFQHQKTSLNNVDQGVPIPDDTPIELGHTFFMIDKDDLQWLPPD